MKKIEAIIEPVRMEAVKDSLSKIGLDGMNVTQIHGFGSEKRSARFFGGGRYEVSFMRKVKLSMIVKDDFVDKVVETIIKSARTGIKGKGGDGKIFVLPVDDYISIRTGKHSL